jgi:hypothetical protein
VRTGSQPVPAARPGRSLVLQAAGRRILPGVEDSRSARVSALLHEAAETHHRVYRIVDGVDDDWASWYADWMVRLSELPTILGVIPTRSELTYILVGSDLAYRSEPRDQRWEDFYARRILDHFIAG